MSIEVLKQALGALIQARKLRFALWRHGCDCRDEHTCDPLQDEYAKQFNDSIIKLEQAIAELESQEPVAWRLESGQAVWFERTDPEANSALPNDVTAIPLYTQPQRTWVGLTDEERYAIEAATLDLHGVPKFFATAIEAKLKEKNT